LLVVAAFPLPSDEYCPPLRYFNRMSMAPQDRVPAYADVPDNLNLMAVFDPNSKKRPATLTRVALVKPGAPATTGVSVSERKPLATPRESVLVIGDSLSIPLGQRLEEHFGRMDDVAFKRVGKVSSGLARPDFFDWEFNLNDLAKTMRPNKVVIMIGANDNKPLRRADGSVAQFGGRDWEDEYARRMQRLFNICRSYNSKVKIYWVGVPVMGEPKFNTEVRKINTVIASLCQKANNCFYVDTWDALADGRGQFTAFIVDQTGERVRIRTDDGVHLAPLGSRILATRFLNAMLTFDTGATAGRMKPAS
jgi:hypothetical protein